MKKLLLPSMVVSLLSLLIIGVLLLAGCAREVPAPPAPTPIPTTTSTPAPPTTTVPTPAEATNSSLKGQVMAIIPSFQQEGLIFPLTTATADNPENAKVTISGPVSRVTVVDSNGWFFFTDLPPGKYQVTASARWYLSQTRTVELAQGQNLDIEPFILDRGKGVISGRIEAGGQPVSNAELRASNVNTGVVTTVTTSKPDGSYSLEVPAGLYMVLVTSRLNPEYAALVEDYNKAAQSFVIEPGDAKTHDIILQTSPTVTLPASSSWQGTWSYSPGPGLDFARNSGWSVSGNWKATFNITDDRLSGSQTGIDLWEGSIEGKVTGMSLTFTSINRKSQLSGGGPVDPQDFVVEATISGNNISGTFRDKIHISSGGGVQILGLTGTFSGTSTSTSPASGTTPTEPAPSTPAAPAEPISITNFQVVGGSNSELSFTVDYTYDGSRGANVEMIADVLSGGRRMSSNFIFTMVRISQGSGKVLLMVNFGLGNPPPGLTTDQIRVEMYVSGSPSFYLKTFDYTKTWSSY